MFVLSAFRQLATLVALRRRDRLQLMFRSICALITGHWVSSNTAFTMSASSCGRPWATSVSPVAAFPEGSVHSRVSPPADPGELEGCSGTSLRSLSRLDSVCRTAAHVTGAPDTKTGTSYIYVNKQPDDKSPARLSSGQQKLVDELGHQRTVS